MTDYPAAPAEVASALRYAEFFGADSRNRLVEDLRHFYRDEDFRHFVERLEFSMIFGEGCSPDLRYGLFRLHSAHAAATWLDARGPAEHDARRLIGILGTVTPEFSVAVDRSLKRNRVKLYFMRLVPEHGDEIDLASRVRDAAGAVGVESGFAPEFDLGKTSIFSVDYYLENAQREVKLYHWGLDRWQERARASLESLGIRSRFAERFFDFVSDRPSREAIFCHRYLPGIPSPTGFAVHQTLDNGQKPATEAILRELMPSAYEKCWEPLRQVEESGATIRVAYFGFSLSSRPSMERFHLYFNLA